MPEPPGGEPSGYRHYGTPNGNAADCSVGAMQRIGILCHAWNAGAVSRHGDS
jgi:hypothetical protein